MALENIMVHVIGVQSEKKLLRELITRAAHVYADKTP